VYNLAKDAEEKRGLSTQLSGRTSAMKAELEKWQKSVVRSLNGEDYK